MKPLCSLARRSLVRWCGAGLCGGVVLAAASCGDGVTPRLSDLRFDGQAPDSPLVLLFSVSFEDDDGDLSEGQLETFINQRATSAGPLPMVPIFVASGVDQDAVSGTLEFVLELSFGDQAPADGSTFALGARVRDGARHTSDLKEITLRLGSE